MKGRWDSLEYEIEDNYARPVDRIDEPSELSFIQGVIPTTLPIRVRIALPTLSFVVIWDFLVEARQNQRLQLDIHHSIPMFFSTTVDRRKASLIHRFTTERLWISKNTVCDVVYLIF